MKYLSNQQNRVRTAGLDANNIEPSNVIWRTDQADKAGGGDVTLTGDYTGQVDVAVDIQIVDNTISGAPSVSDPVFSGVGNGVISAVAADATVDVQAITITLVDMGTANLPAQAPFQGVIIEALVTGTDGNDITVTINRTGVISLGTIYSLPHDLQTGGDGNLGDEWNFGNSLIDARTGDVDPNPANTPRVRFGIDPQVYRLYKTFDGTAYTYFTTPDVVRPVGQGAKVFTAFGTYTITVHNGVDADEVYVGITTLYDALIALQSSAMVHIVGVGGGPAVIVNDLHPNGMAIDDLSVYTDTSVQNVVGNGSTSVQRAALDLNFTTSQSGSTENVVFTCTANATHNSETWDVYGSNSGALPSATTGIPYVGGAYTALIPSVNLDGGGVSADASILVELILIDRVAGEVPPSLCVVSPRMGSAVHDGVWEFRFSSRPADPCECNSGELIGAPSDFCLGLSTEGGGEVALSPVFLRRQRLVTALRTFIEDNTTPPQTVDDGDVQWLKTSAAIFADTLAQLALETATINYPLWQATHLYHPGDIIEDTGTGGASDSRFIAVQLADGTSGASSPTWPVLDGAVTDGTVVWVNLGKKPLVVYDAAFSDWKTDAALIGGQNNPQNYPAWAPGMAIGRLVTGVVPTQQNGFRYFPDAYTGAPWNQAVTGTVEPHWPIVDAATVGEFCVTDTETTSEIKWIAYPYPDLAVSPGVTDTYYDRYRAQMSEVLLAAGIDTNFEQASDNGDGCWLDAKASAWFAYTGSDRPYAPIQPGVYYHTSASECGATGNIVYNSTHEWGFGPKFGCPDKLKFGDIIRVTITGTGNSAGGANGYQQGDTFTATVVHADPLQLTGGQDGDDTLTWSVTGTVHGLFAPYGLVTTEPFDPVANTYLDAGLTFLITPGAIDFRLGDSFRFEVEGGRFKYRFNGGSWSANTQIADSVTLTGGNGLVANFIAGEAPSYVALDTWSFIAEAVNGPKGIRSLIDEALTWHTSLQLTIVPNDGGIGLTYPMIVLMIGEHTIPSNATITLQGSNDSFGTTPFALTIPWAERNIYKEFPAATYSAYRLLVNQPGSIQWLYLSDTEVEPMLTGATTIKEVGTLVRNLHLPTVLQREGLAADVSHTCTSKASMTSIVNLLTWAGKHERGRFGMIPNAADTECAIVTSSDPIVTFKDEMDFQALDPSFRAIQIDLSLEVIP